MKPITAAVSLSPSSDRCAGVSGLDAGPCRRVIAY
jgi:hypothetical protein